MRDKEWLLSFDCPLRFIFSHSALKEGWDNPNVFQVCTLIEQKSTFTCRQKIGRGLRLCVDQHGNRVEDRDTNILHVMANENFAEFADTLQKEIEQETGVKFGVLQLNLFVGQTYEEQKTVEKTVPVEQAAAVVEVLKANGVITDNGSVSSTFSDEEITQLLDEQAPTISASAKNVIASVISTAFDAASDEADCITKEVKIDVEAIANAKYTETVTEEKTISYEDAAALMTHLEKQNLITKDGKIKDTMKAQLAAGTLDLGARFTQAAQRAIVQTIERADNRPPIRDASREVTVHLKKQAILSPEFMELWDRIKQKTTYRVKIDRETLAENCISDLRNMPSIPKARLVSQTADIQIQNAGVSHVERELRVADLKDSYDTLPDVLRVITAETLLKRSTVSHIIKESGRGRDFLNNPQAFTEKALEIIARNRHNLAIDGIRYIKLAGEEYYVQEIYYPCIGGIKTDLPDDKARGKYIEPKGNMASFDLGAPTSNNTGYWGVDFPTYRINFTAVDAAAPFELIYFKDQGFYIGVHMKDTIENAVIMNEYHPGPLDPICGMVTKEDVLSGHPVGANVSVVRTPFVEHGDEHKFEPVVFGFYEGDWHQGINYYKNYYNEVLKGPNSGYPSWIDEIESCLVIDFNKLNIKYNDMVKIAEEAKTNNVNALLINSWHAGGTGTLANKDWGTEKDLKNAISSIRELGMRVIFEAKVDARLEKPVKCAISDVYRMSLVNTVKDIIGLGADGVLYNSLSAGIYCGNKDGTHPHNRDGVMLKSIYTALSSLTDFLTKKDALLADTVFFNNMQNFSTMYFNEGTDCGLPGIHAKAALKYIDNKRALSVSVAGLRDYNLINMALLYGYRINYYPGYGFKSLKDIPVSAEYGKKCVKFRTGLAEWIWDAVFCDTVGGSVSCINGDKALYSVFINKNGKKAVVIANTSSEEKEYEVSTDGKNKFKAHFIDKAAVKNTGKVSVPGNGIVVLTEE